MTLFENLLGHTLIAADNVWGLMGVMCIGVALSIHLEQKYQWASKVSGAIIALIMAMVLANLGVIPTNCTLYDDIVWGIVVPMAIPLLLLQCNLSRVWKDTGRMLVVFLIGALGTVVGAFLAYYLLRGPFGDAQGYGKITISAELTFRTKAPKHQCVPAARTKNMGRYHIYVCQTCDARMFYNLTAKERHDNLDWNTETHQKYCVLLS